MNILFSAGGRRVEIIEIFIKELPNDKIFVADIVNSAPSLYIADEHFIIPKFTDKNCLKKVLNICENNNIDIIIPLIDPEVDFYSENYNTFLRKNVCLMLSGKNTVAIARNKWNTFNYFKDNDIPVADTFINKNDVSDFPVIAKPVHGSAGKGIFYVDNREELYNNRSIGKDYVYQKFISGDEITVDIIGDGKGNLVAVSQRKRLKVREGEVERGVTVFYSDIDFYVRKIVSLLKPFGLINIQLYKDNNDKLYFQEINLRLGGGVPLTYNAGINIPVLLKELAIGEYIYCETIKAENNLYMFRYDQAIYLKKEDIVSD